jgi:putative transposase
MPRPLRQAQGGLIYHALNRANARLAIFDDADYAAFGTRKGVRSR